MLLPSIITTKTITAHGPKNHTTEAMEATTALTAMEIAKSQSCRKMSATLSKRTVTLRLNLPLLSLELRLLRLKLRPSGKAGLGLEAPLLLSQESLIWSQRL